MTAPDSTLKAGDRVQVTLTGTVVRGPGGALEVDLDVDGLHVLEAVDDYDGVRPADAEVRMDVTAGDDRIVPLSVPLHEWHCPKCGATTRARMADHPQPSTMEDR